MNESLTIEGQYDPWYFYVRDALAGKFKCIIQDRWETDVKDMPKWVADSLVLEHYVDGDITCYLRGDGYLLWLRFGDGHVNMNVSAHSHENAAAVVTHLRDHFREVSLREADDTVRVDFSFLGPTGAGHHSRKIKTLDWEKNAANYSAATRRALDALFSKPLPDEGGKLIIWYGPPGTGKTSAIRAALSKWRDTVPVYVTDPDALFGASPSYMLSVLLNGTSRSADELFDNKGNVNSAPSRLLLILEDSGEFLSANARHQAGQGLSRLLNVVDGLIGQGLNLTVLITTNEPLGSFHPAVTRPGRCLATVAFEPLSASEAGAWLATHGIAEKPSSEMTIAQLYAMVSGRDPGASSVPLGDAAGMYR